MQEFKSITRLLGASSLAVLAFAAPALAATAAPPEKDSPVLQEVIVTAQRRTESVQKSSLSIQVVGGEAVQRAGATKAEDLNTLVPGLKISTVGATIQVAIRGVGDQTTNPLGNPTVAFNVDGVYIGRPSSIGMTFFDIDRIEVLKGPQGTLYGRNAAGGAVNLLTVAPKLGVTSGFIEGELGNYSSKRVTGALNAPITSTLAVRAAFQVVDRNGYMSDGASDQKTEAARLRALWKPSDTVSMQLNLDVSHQGGAGDGQALLPRLAGENPWLSINSPSSQARLSAAFPPGSTTFGKPSESNDFVNVSGQLDWDLGPATLTVIPAYRHTDETSANWNGFSYSQHNIAKQTSLEARLSHADQSLKWVVGLYGFDENQQVAGTAIANPFIVANLQTYTPTDRAYAGFGEATYSLTSQLRLIGGLRYTSEHKTLNGVTVDTSANHAPNEVMQGDKTYTSTNWKGGLEYDLSPANLLFFTADTGFKAGGLNPSSAPNAYNPEDLTAYTVGSRNRFLENRLQINVEAYYWDYKNRQESAIGFTPAGNIAFLTSNAASATLKGASIDIVAKPTNNDTLQLFTEYNDAKYGKFIYQIPTPFFNPATTACAATPVATPPGLFTQLDCSNRQLTKAPTWTGSFGYNHRFDLTDGATLDANVNGQFSSSYWLAADFTPNERASAYTTANASLTLTSASRAWSLTTFVRNIGNSAVYTSANEEPLNGTLLTVDLAAPRTYGARLRFQF